VGRFVIVFVLVAGGVVLNGCEDDAGRSVDAAPDGIPWNPPDWSLCSESWECGLASVTCCGVCGAPSLADVEGVNMERRTDQVRAVCGDEPPECPGCPTMPNPYLQASCEDVGYPGGNVCQAVDIQAGPISACVEDADCVVRAPTCCGSCSELPASGYIAIHRDQGAAFNALVCNPAEDCPACEPVTPEGIVAVCADGPDPGTGGAPVARRCEVQAASESGG